MSACVRVAEWLLRMCVCSNMYRGNYRWGWSVRDEGGILENSEESRFTFDSIDRSRFTRV